MNSQFASYTTICLHKEKLNQRGAYESQLDVKDGKIFASITLQPGIFLSPRNAHSWFSLL
jgi:hypothetical protein